MERQHRRNDKLRFDRVNALSDGVVAIVITLLVLEISVPTDHNFAEDGLVGFMRRVRHDVVIYAASFWLIGTYWVQHHAMSHYVRYSNRILIWLNLLHLFVISLLPFTTQLKTAYAEEPKALLVFGINHFFCGVTLFALWRYLASRPQLLDRGIDNAVDRSMSQRILVSPVVTLVAIGLSFFNMQLGSFTFLAAPLFYLSHRLVDTHWHDPADAAAHTDADLGSAQQ